MLTDGYAKDLLLEAREYGNEGAVHIIATILRLPSGESKILAYQSGQQPFREEKMREIIRLCSPHLAPGEDLYFKHGYGRFSLAPGAEGSDRDNFVWEKHAPWVKLDDESRP